MKSSKIQYVIYVIIGLLVIFAPIILNSKYQTHLLVLAGIYILLASGLNLITGYVGQLSLTHGAFLGIGAYTTALLNMHFGTPFIVNFFASAFVACFIAYLFGFVTLTVRGSAFIIMTVAFLHILHLLALNLVKFTQGQMGIGNIDKAQLFGMEFTSRLSYYYLVVVVSGIVIYIIYKLVHSRFGRAWVSIRENEDLAKSIGINVFKSANLAFILGAFFGGLGGSLYAHYITFISPDLFVFAITTQLLVMLIMGGKGTVMGPVIGAIIFTLLPEYLRIVEEWRLPIFGIILIVAIIFLPNGIIKLPSQLKGRKMKKTLKQENN
jgi:branched-chain amino acid transport system permease protein